MSDNTQDLSMVRAEVQKLKDELNKLNTEKESFFNKKEELKKAIAEKISLVKASKESRDAMTSEVKLSKEKRTELETDLKAKIETIKKLQAEKAKVSAPAPTEGRRAGPRKNPAMLKKEIEELEHKIETDAMSFDKETKMMKLIKEKKKELEKMESVSEAYAKSGTLSHEIDELKKILNITTKDQKKKAKESQGKHEEMIVVSKEIDELKKQEREAFAKFVELKQKFTELNAQLKEKLAILGEEFHRASEVVREKKDRVRKEKEKKDTVDLEMKKAQVQEKMKKGMKLTTEDLIVFQSGE